MRRQLRDNPGAELAVDLDAQSVTGPDQTTYSFEINAFDKHRLLNGLDDVGLTMEFSDKIEAFKDGYRAKHGWASLMADLYGMDPARIERLRSSLERLGYFDPAKIWDALDPDPSVTPVNIGSGVGFVALPFARRYPQATAVGCDILKGMVALLKVAASEEGLDIVTDVRRDECVEMRRDWMLNAN